MTAIKYYGPITLTFTGSPVVCVLYDYDDEGNLIISGSTTIPGSHTVTEDVETPSNFNGYTDGTMVVVPSDEGTVTAAYVQVLGDRVQLTIISTESDEWGSYTSTLQLTKQ